MKSPVWMTTPTGVSMASATQSTSEWVTRMGSMVKGPMVNFSFGVDLDQLGLVEQLVLFELALDVGQGELGGVDGDLELGEDPGQAADVVLVAVGEDDGADVCLVFNQVGDIGDDDIDAEQFRLREHEAGVDHDNVVFPAEREAVHAELAQPAEGDDFQFFCLHLSGLMLTPACVLGCAVVEASSGDCS